MYISRRNLTLGGIAGLGLVACAAPPPAAATVAITAQAAANANPGPDGAGRPLTISVLQLRGPSAFNAADFFALQDPATALGGDLVKADQIVLAPGGSGTLDIGVEAGATVLALVAGYRDPAGKVFRATRPLPATGAVTLTVTAGATGLTVA